MEDYKLDLLAVRAGFIALIVQDLTGSTGRDESRSYEAGPVGAGDTNGLH